MNYIKKTVSILFVATFICSSSITMAKTVKPHHQDVLQGSNGKADCSVCHDTSKKITTPSETACLSCHGTKQDLVDLTKRKTKDHSVEPNPHESLHYGTDLSCTYCHSEHKESKVYCNNCHEFDYKKMKR